MKTLLKKHDKNSIGLIGHTIVNFPTPELCRESIKIMVEEGVSLIELQIPFSEPIADGPLFMAANHAALAAGVTIKQSFELMAEMTEQYSIPFVFMTYVNVPFTQGYANFIKNSVYAGAQGCIVPDLPLDIASDFLKLCEQQDFAAIEIIPPNIDEARLKTLLHYANGFIYAVARSGVTGSKTNFNDDLKKFLQRLQNQTDLAIAVGFGISTAEDIQFLKPYADYAIVGSQALRILEQKGVLGLRQFWRDLKQAASS